MSSVIISGDTSGQITVSAPAVAGTNTLTLQAATATNAVNTLGTAVASTSGTSIDFTGLPSWIKKITLLFSGVSTTDGTNYLIQLGTGGTPTNTGYTSTCVRTWSLNQVNAQTSTSGFILGSDLATFVWSGSLTFTNITGNTWVLSGLIGSVAGTTMTMQATGTVSLAGVLNMVRITTTSGTPTFDAGTVNILYEG